MKTLLRLGAVRARTALLSALLAVAGVAHAADPPRFSGTWAQAKPVASPLLTLEGKSAPLNAAARAVLLRRKARGALGPDADPVARCLPPGTPRILWQRRPFLVVQTPRKITFIHEFQHVLRHVYLDESLPQADDIDPLFGGTSVGHFEGATLVIQSTGFSELDWLDDSGLPESSGAHITERLALLNDSTLEDRVTIDDPIYYRRSWTVRTVFHRVAGEELAEDICAERLLPPALRQALGR
jgi:hypothetical protein